ncbi:MAG: peptidoglycan DD-metalloendopeptidase family protein [Porticoccaceae bacterium]|nr:peptidoglycan DD-metalloendopeptidase family protein [Porticoccaceae bacterium]
MSRAVNTFGWLAVLALLALLLNACMTPPPAPVVERSQPPPPDRINHHVVSRGDTLHTIAWRYELDHQQLIDLNGLQPPYQLQPGQRLRLGDSPISVPAGPARAVAIADSPVIGSPITAEPIVAEPARPEPSASDSGSLEWVPMPDEEPLPDEPPADPSLVTQPDAQIEPLPAPAEPVVPDVPAAPAEPAGPWQWPATGTVTREYDAAKVFKGINIHTTRGTPVKAAGNGTVVYAGSGLRGYGQLIILKHDDTYLSAYAHNNRILVAENDTVSQGQAIGEVGGDPSDPGRLYFEIREHGKPVDPEKLLPPR